jgi:oligopeptidase B
MPTTTYEIELTTGEASVVRAEPPPKGFDPDAYVVAEEVVPSKGGANVPVTLLRRRDLPDGSAPTVLHGYGGYGINQTASLSLPLLSMLDRGWVLAYAHVRGGGELGPAWHSAGSGKSKPNSIADMVACAERLVASGVTSESQLAARGGSAGGLLVCAAANRRPDLFRAVVAAVPVVDVLTTLLDPSQRLTQMEWGELGNPLVDHEVYEVVRSYSPYDNIEPKAYPAMLLTAGLRDSRVPYWEPAKFVAKLRATKTDNRMVLLRTAMESGHQGRAERYRWDESFVMAFLASQLEPVS